MLRRKAAFMGISEQLLAAPPKLSSVEAAVPHDVKPPSGLLTKNG